MGKNSSNQLKTAPGEGGGDGPTDSWTEVQTDGRKRKRNKKEKKYENTRENYRELILNLAAYGFLCAKAKAIPVGHSGFPISRVVVIVIMAHKGLF